LAQKNKQINNMKGIKNFIWSLLAEDGKLSSKRFAGIMATTFLCVTLLWNSFSEEHIAPATILVECVTAVAIGSLGISAAQTIFKKDENKTVKP
jgi:hypothetical protein